MWFLTAAFMVVVFSLLASHVWNRRWTFVDVLDRQWLMAKQEAQRRWRREVFRPSEAIALMQFDYPNRFEFWLDQEAKAMILKTVSHHVGPIVVNIDPVMAQKDLMLKTLFDHENVIRSFRITPVREGRDAASAEIEDFLSQNLEQSDLARRLTIDCPADRIRECLGRPVKVLPQAKGYYKKGPLYGSSSLWETGESLGLFGHQRDTASQFVFELPLRVKGSRLDLPTQMLASATAAMGCRDYSLSRESVLALKDCQANDKHVLVSDPLPLFFYGRPFKKVTFDRGDDREAGDLTKAASDFVARDWGAAHRLLVIEITDSASKVATSLGTSLTMGELLATGVSNIVEAHYPLSYPLSKWLASLMGVLFMALLFSMVGRSSPLRFLGVLVFGLFSFACLDFLLTFLGNFRTESMEPMVASSFFGVVALAYVTRRDFQERRLVEQAFKGYVSEERLTKLLSGEESLSLTGRRKELSLLLLDIVNFSQLVKNIPIENVFVFAQRFFSAIDPIIFKYHGVIDKKTGDGLLAFFGDGERGSEPRHHSAYEALRAGLEIQTLLKKIDFADLGIHSSVELRIGINSGPMMIGNTGSSSHFNYTVLGEPVNFTQRLETACPPGEILLGPASYESISKEPTISAFVESLQMEEFFILPKHESEAVKVYRVRLDGTTLTEP